MKTVTMTLEHCPTCGELMLPTPNQDGWHCPACAGSPSPAKEPKRIPTPTHGSPARQSSPPRVNAPRSASPAVPRRIDPIPPNHAPGSPRNRTSLSVPPSPSPLDRRPARHEDPSGIIVAPDYREFEAESLVGCIVGGRYRIESVLGQGSMGTVYRGIQVSLKKPFAIKVLLPSLTRDPQFAARFQQEAQIAASIKHPGLVEVYDYGVENGLAYYVMELLEGKTLADYVQTERVLPCDEAVRIVAAAAEAVSAAHEKGIVHRDLKPANIFLTRDPSGRELIKVLDFGVSKALNSAAANAPQLTVAGAICGTPAYMSPEQAAGRSVDGRSDQYSLAIVLYRLLAGKVPFDAAESVVVMGMHIDQPPPKLEESVPASLRDTLFRALEKRPEDRFRTAQELADALRASMESTGEIAAQPARRSRPEGPSRPRPGGLSSRPSAAGRASRGASKAVEEEEVRPARGEKAKGSAGRRMIWIAASAAIGVIAVTAVGMLLFFQTPKTAQPATAPEPPKEAPTTAVAAPSTTGPARSDNTHENRAEPDVKDRPVPQSPSLKTTPPPLAAVSTPRKDPPPRAHTPSTPTPRPGRMTKLSIMSKVEGIVAIVGSSRKEEPLFGTWKVLEIPAGHQDIELRLKSERLCHVAINVPEPKPEGDSPASLRFGADRKVVFRSSNGESIQSCGP